MEGLVMSEKLERFILLIKTIFEIDKSDLDFGIYRIINIRKAEIEEFLSKGLPEKVQEALIPFASNTEVLEKRIKEIENTCSEVGIEIVASKMADEYAQLKSQLTSGIDLSSLETDVYSGLYTFFNRYYDEGDFISKRRYKEGVYAIPYEGEEVKLYWANQDQYYIKTTENFKDYVFKLDDERSVHFRLVDATLEKDNNKEASGSKRVFTLYEENDENPEIKTFEAKGNELIIRFIFDIPEDKKRKHKEDNFIKIANELSTNHKNWLELLSRIPNKDTKKEKTLLEKHLDAYVAKNTFDYFIHKDLRGFLNRELDFFIKSEIIHLDDLDTANEKRVDTYLAKVRAIKRVGKIIIDFLAQIEDFQKKIWLKKKFVITTDWCITLDQIPESFYNEILKNHSQIQEWIEMYAIDEVEGFSDNLSIDFLKKNQTLLLDTRHYNHNFKERVISSITNLDQKTNGVLINSENFQALNIISCKYQGKIDSCYIDPPYNTKSSEIMYKNGYKHSSWLSLVEQRINKAKHLFDLNSSFCVTIDDVEYKNLSMLCCMLFGHENLLGNVVIKNNPSGRSTVSGFAVAHEYALFYSTATNGRIGRLERTEEQTARYDQQDEGGLFEWVNFRKHGGFKEDSPKMFYPMCIKNDKVRVPKIDWDEKSETWIVLEKFDEEEKVVYPIDENGVNRRWKWGIDRTRKEIDNFCIRIDRTGQKAIYMKARINDEGMLPLTIWDKKEYSSTSYGTNLLKDLFGYTNSFSYPKSVIAVKDCLKVINSGKKSIVLDFFAGSGTTAHAVISLNKEDSGDRKYLLVEMGDYFDTVTVPRIKKSIYASGIKDWKEGKPVNRNEGVSQIVKQICLESYEDALTNIYFSEKDQSMQSLFGDEYLINYMFDLGTRDSLLYLDQFKTPFEYKMKIVESNETKEKIIDLAETFNYLVGLSVYSQSVTTYFEALDNSNGSYEGAVRLCEDIDGEFAFKKIVGTLPDGRKTLIIWRNITEDIVRSNAALDVYFENNQTPKIDLIYVNGDNNLANLRNENDQWKVNLIEATFKECMFEEV